MTGPENERLAVLESQYCTLQGDVSEIKADVKSLVQTQASLATALAIRDAADKEHRSDRASTGVWVRTFLPLIVAFVAMLISFTNLFLAH